MLGLAVPGAAAAQDRPYSAQEERWVQAAWPDDVYFAARNALVSGLVTALIAALRDDIPVGDAFLGGAAGGAIVYVGKRVAAGRFSGAGILGRQVASMGSSVSRNAGLGQSPLQELVFPLGVARLYWDRGSGHVELKPDVNAMGWTLRAAFEPRLELDWRRTLSAGAPVFLTRNAMLDGDAAGRTLGSVILADPRANLPIDEILAHEHVHVIQLDHHFALWGEALEQWAFGRLGAGPAGVASRVDLVLPTMLMGLGIGVLWSADANPLESEAYYMQMRGR